MMRILLTEDILLDVLFKQEPEWKDSAQIWKLCETGQVCGYVSALSLNNILFLLHAQLSFERCASVLNDMRMIFHTADLMDIDLLKASALSRDDLRSAIEEMIAGRILADCIITNDPALFPKSTMPVMTPADFPSSLQL